MLTLVEQTNRAQLISFDRISGIDSSTDVRHLVFIYSHQTATFTMMAGDAITLHLPFPRVFPLASAAVEMPGQIHLTVEMSTVIESDSLTYDELSQLCGKPVAFSVTKQPHFHLPASVSAPIILLVEHTAIAYARALIQQRKWQRHSGENWLIFAGEKRDEDNYYADEWLRYKRDEILTRYDTAHQDTRVPSLADRIEVNREMIWHWLNQGAVVYLACTEDTAADLDSELILTFQECGALTANAAHSFLQTLKQQQRLKRIITS